jgi:hypothetical protein
MQQLAMKSSELDFQHVENTDVQYPWFLIQPENRRVRYRHDWIADFFGEQDKKQDGLGLSFNYPKYIKPGTKLNIGIPLPESVHRYQADVILAGENENGYEIGIWLHTSSDADLELLLRSCEYAS